MHEPVEEIDHSDNEREQRKPVMLDEWQPLIPVGQAFMFDEFAKENIAPDGSQPEGDRVED
jgi:hypothetical protein